MLFQVRYAAKRVLGDGRSSAVHTSHHSLLIEADSRADAYVTAVDHLIRQGSGVKTDLRTFAEQHKGALAFMGAPEDEGPRFLLSFTDEDIAAIEGAGLPTQDGYGDVEIQSIEEYTVTPKGKVVATPSSGGPLNANGGPEAKSE